MSPVLGVITLSIVIISKLIISKVDTMQTLHWQRLCDNAGHSISHYLLALATLVNATQIGLFLFLVTSPKKAKASTVMTVECRCC
jgi:hypothetical protein